MGNRPLVSYLFLISVIFYNIQVILTNTRNKRQIHPDLPRILTQDGHLVFQTGSSHNITFKATNGGYINVNSDNLAVITQTVKDNKAAIDQLRTAPTASSGIETRLLTIEGRLNNLQPTGQVQIQFISLGHRIDLLQATMPANIDSRLTEVENGLSDLQPTGEVATQLNTLTQRGTSLARRIRIIENRHVRIDQLLTRVSQLQNTVQELQTLLTTNECDSNPCSNGGICEDTYNGYICRCPETYQGPTCSDDVNECVIYAGTDLGCQNGATCTNTVGGFTCQCTANWHGIRCTESHDDCTGASSTELCGHGTCVNTPRVQPGQAKYTCICDDGWTSSGSDPACVVDVNECDSNHPACSTNPPVPCINLPGSFTCGACPTGYNGNGFTCSDINECLVNNGGCSLSPSVQCVNTIGSRTCGPCPSGYQGNGIMCIWVGQCQTNNGGCHPLASCTESSAATGRTCTCPSGYVGNGIGSAGCVAQGAVSGPCSSTPCLNGAACQNVDASSYRCVCQSGFSGQTCQININECSSNPCQNGGSCTDRVNGYNCQCTQSFTGPNCEIEQQACGGNLEGESGTFRYPLVPGTQYAHQVSCAWRITTTYGKILMLTFPQFSIESHPQCFFDNLQIYDGPSDSSYMIGKYCGNSAPNNGQPINSTHHHIYLWFRSDTSVAADGFTVQWTSAMPVCGGNLEGSDHGVVTSPGHPGNYPHNRDCVWTISVSPGNFILFSFATVAIETHPNCSYDYLEIRNGGLSTSPLLRRYCNSTLPPPVATTGPTAWIKFHSDESLSDSGFQITYAAAAADPGCGGRFNSETGIIISPNYPNAYNHDAQCVWIVTVNPMDKIKFTFTDMDLEGHADCSYDYIEVRDGPNENAPLIGRYCGDAMPAPRTTTQNTLYVKFVSDLSVNHAGFRAKWEVACGGVFTSPTGIVQSPYFPQAYPSNRQCEYLIMLPVGNRVTLTFNSFDIEAGQTDDDCNYDFLEIRDGGTSSSPLIGKYCGPQIPQPQSSTGEQMYLKFYTDGSVQNVGFSAVYVSEEASCGGPLTGTSGSLESPGHPTIYAHGVNCTWHIQVPAGLVIRLTFHSFSLENHANCRYDSVAIYDNSSVVQSSLIGRYCGNVVPPVSTSTDNAMTVQFISDASVAFEGFTANYVTINVTTLCGTDVTDSTGVITSPNFPDNYPHQRQCIWTITAPEGNQILLNVTDFALENHYNCRYDYLEIRNGGYSTSPLQGTYCGTTIDRIIVSHSNRMYLKLSTDASQSAPGFRIYYDSTATGCGADLTTPTGSFVSPNYPNPYGHNAIRDGDSIGPLLGKFCGNTIPDAVTSSSNKMWIKYRTDYSVSGRGFHAHYQSLCTNTLTDFSGVIESPNFPNPYPHDENCTWTISTTLGNTVNMSFSHFTMESHPNCQYDYLQINDGGEPTSSSLGTFCGTDLPPPLSSTTDQVWINFVTDYSVARDGFRLEYITDGCGGYFNTPTGSFTSPNYPNPYPHRRVCTWKIVVDTGSAIKLTIGTFDLEAHRSCRFDALEVYSGLDDSGPLLVRLCHEQNSPQILTSTGNMMFVRFRSDSSINGNGFSASYKAVSGGCGGNFTTRSGSIMSPNFGHGDYPHNTDCEWLITVEDERTVELTFTNFDVEGSTGCVFDYVAVYDGATRNASQLMKYCGASLPSPVKYVSSSNQMFIRMRTDSSVSKPGFKADYVTGCGGVLNTEDGDGAIFSPGYPDNYPRRSNCSWLIMADHSSDRITLTFTHMDVERRDNCNKDYVQVLDGNDAQSPEIGRYCGTEAPAAITSQGSALFVVFVSDYSFQSSGFRAAYTKSTSACGADFTSQSGSFTSPGYPNSYPTNTECVWNLKVSPGNRVQLSFSFFNLEDHENCNLDYVELHEGELGGPLVGRFCGNTIPSNLTAYNGLWVKFRSDESSTGRGFMASYSAVYGGDLIGNSGQIASPGYPLHYPHYVRISWTVTVPTGMRVKVTFVTMDIETYYNACYFDYVKIRNGATLESPVVGTYCGTELPDVYVSPGNQIHVQFKSDWSSSGQGFLLNWEATSDYPITTLPPTAGTSPVPGCGGILNVTDSIQTVTSPGYPIIYQNQLNCIWNLRAPLGSRVWMNITYIYLEAHYACNFDVLKIFNGANIQDSQLGEYCGRSRNDDPLLTTGNVATLQFKTDYSVTKQGFSLDYKTECGGDTRANSGTIKSPGYPSNYGNNKNCTWTVYVPTGRTIRIQFDDNFNIQGTQGSCTSDYVLLRNGDNLLSPPLGNTNGRYCGNNKPAAMETNSNKLSIQFVSDASVTTAGFSLNFNEVHVTCGGQYSLDSTRTSDTFTSPNYPQNYPHNVDCVWVITVPAHERIRIDFLGNFSIETHTSCNFDFLEFRDGGTINSPSIGKYCGYTLPNTIYSTGNVLYARFRTDDSVPRTGFKVQYSIATCGGTYSGNSGTITSPNYPANYEPNSECIWSVQAPIGHYLTFTFTAFSLQTSSNCSTVDFVEIRDLNSTGPVLLQRCGFSIPQPISTSDSYGMVRFVSDGRNQYPGFSLNYAASVDACGGELTTPSGTFTSPNFPGYYAHSRRCTWRITVPQGRRITFTFNVFNIESHRYCFYDHVAIYNGLFKRSPLLGRYCGDNPVETVETSGNTARVVFRTDASESNGGFSISYHSDNEAVCGGILTSPSGNITSPGYADGNYTNRLECIWEIRNTGGYVNSSLVVRVNDLRLESHWNSFCWYDSLEIREREDGNALARFCGNNTLPDPIITPSPSLWLKFKTDASIVDRGFHLSYNTSQCGGMLMQPNGVISSPNFPQNYDHNDACAWTIMAEEGTQIVVNFTHFNLETHANCQYDYLEIFNGEYSTSPSIGKFCGTNMPSTIRSQSRALRIVFFSDGSESAQGFRLTYSFVAGGCGGLFHTHTGVLSTPNYPRSYPHNAECVWDINVQSGYHVSLTFNPPFDMEHSGNCTYDYVEVSDVFENGTLDSLGRWCYNVIPPVLRSTGNQLVVKFRSDPATNGNGFSANWEAVCGGILNNKQGILLSPGFPGRYSNNMMCNYSLNMDPQHYIVLNFDSDNFDIESARQCRFDSVSVYAGNSTSDRSLGKFCGTVAPQTLSSLGKMFIQFKTDRSVTGTGFRARYRVSECGGVYTAPSGVIQTLEGLDTYHNNHNCTWNVTVAANKIIQVKFLQLDLEGHYSCRYDYVNILDGPNLTSPSIGRFCGNVIPTQQLRTTSNKMIVNFITDISVTRSGFKLVYFGTYGEAVGCGGRLNATTGGFGSVDIDNDGNYEPVLDCRWMIVAPVNKVIRLTIPTLDIESDPMCIYDSLRIYDGMSDDDPLVGTYCGTNTPPVFTSTSNFLYINFISDVSITARGFNATYTQLDSPCGGLYTSNSSLQTITSPGYPNPIGQDLRCRWTIEAPLTTDSVDVNVTAINLQDSQNCNIEFLELRDFPMGNRGRAVHACGVIPPSIFHSVSKTVQINYVVTNGNSPGFQLSYTTGSCNRTYSGNSGRIVSPGWPGSYPHGTNCQFRIEAPNGTTVSLYFNTFHVESHSTCRFDYLEIRNGSEITSPVIRHICGYVIPDPVFTTVNNVSIGFVTDTSVTYPGYDISYTATDQGMGCGGNLTGINGSLTSPGYPGNYTDSSTCIWTIRVPQRRVITIAFTDIRMFDTVNCATDYVIVYDADSMFGRFCGGEVPATMTTSGNVAFVKHVSDGIGSAIGFRITYSS